MRNRIVTVKVKKSVNQVRVRMLANHMLSATHPVVTLRSSSVRL